MPLKTSVVLLAMIITTGIVHGRFTDRWGPPRSVVEAGARLDQLPREMCGWTSTATEVSERTRQIAGAVNLIHRTYTDPTTADSIRILLVCGRPGPVSRHPPTVCFTSSGMQQVTPVENIALGSSTVTPGRDFARCTFSAGEDFAPLVTSWSWSVDGHNWQAPSQPRLEFAHHPWLYKLYVMTAPEPNDNDSPVLVRRKEFIDQLFSTLDDLLL